MSIWKRFALAVVSVLPLWLVSGGQPRGLVVVAIVIFGLLVVTGADRIVDLERRIDRIERDRRQGD